MYTYRRLVAIKLLALCTCVWTPIVHAYTTEEITTYLDRLNLLLTDASPPDTESITVILEPFIIRLAPLAKRTFKSYYTSLNDIERNQVDILLGQRLVLDLATIFSSNTISQVRLDRFSVDDATATAVLHASGNPNPIQLEIKWIQLGKNWHLHTIKIDEKKLSSIYYKLFAEILNQEYSVEVLYSNLRRLPYIQLEDFSGGTPGKNPTGWRTLRRTDDQKPKHYYVREDQENYYVAAQDTGLSVILGRPLHWNPRQYPILTWCWRANALPPGGNEKLNHANDSAAGIYVLFSRNLLGVPRQVKYVWSTTLPEGTIDRRNKIWRPYFFVVESGAKNLGKWTFEAVNLYEAHQYAFENEKPPNRTLAIGLLTDANSTDSYAEAFYADFRAWSLEAQDQGLIENYCNCFSNNTTSLLSETLEPNLSDLPSKEAKP